MRSAALPCPGAPGRRAMHGLTNQAAPLPVRPIAPSVQVDLSPDEQLRVKDLIRGDPETAQVGCRALLCLLRRQRWLQALAGRHRAAGGCHAAPTSATYPSAQPIAACRRTGAGANGSWTLWPTSATGGSEGASRLGVAWAGRIGRLPSHLAHLAPPCTPHLSLSCAAWTSTSWTTFGETTWPAASSPPLNSPPCALLSDAALHCTEPSWEAGLAC